jgi:hypothetical protein
MANAAIIELDRNCAKVVEDIVKLERKIFPKHESLASFFENELKKKNTGLLYLQVNGELAGYVMYSLPSSLYASITKLAGTNPIFSFFSLHVKLSYLTMLTSCLRNCLRVFFVFKIVSLGNLVAQIYKISI